jgi:hypothetical protein
MSLWRCPSALSPWGTGGRTCPRCDPTRLRSVAGWGARTRSATRRQQRLDGLWERGREVASEVNAATLPRRALQGLACCAFQAFVGVGDHQADAGESATASTVIIEGERSEYQPPTSAFHQLFSFLQRASMRASRSQTTDSGTRPQSPWDGGRPSTRTVGNYWRHIFSISTTTYTAGSCVCCSPTTSASSSASRRRRTHGPA